MARTAGSEPVEETYVIQVLHYSEDGDDRATTRAKAEATLEEALDAIGAEIGSFAVGRREVTLNFLKGR
ncbi:MAG TPA: hypothetical protein VLF41_00350 [Candidatus Nanoarchaeia archaeon]|nr:hypothetical protein [Candidatus Nanoarchaeia archaeon]